MYLKEVSQNNAYLTLVHSISHRICDEHCILLLFYSFLKKILAITYYNNYTTQLSITHSVKTYCFHI